MMKKPGFLNVSRASCVSTPKKVRMNMSQQDTTDKEERTLEDDGEVEQASDETETEREDGGERDETATQEQAGVLPPHPMAAQAAPARPLSTNAAPWKEDPFNFDESTVEIGVTLHPLHGGPPEERLVTICIHNHHDTPLYRSFRQSDLSEQFPLDRLQRGIAQSVQAFLTALSERRQARWEEEQRLKQSQKKTAPRATATSSSGASVSKQEEQKDATTPSTSPEVTPPLAAAVTKSTQVAPVKQGKHELVQQTLF